MSNEQLVEQIRNGYHVTDSMQRLYEDNLPLIKKFIKPYAYYEPEEDLLQEAYFGLREAVRHYESSENALFMTYAWYWIKQSIQRYMENSGSVLRISSAYRQKIARYKKTVQEFEQTYGHTPTDEEIAKKLGISIEKVREVYKISQDPVSLETPIGEEDDSHLGDFIKDERTMGPEEYATIEMLKEELQGVLGTLTDREEKVLRLRFGLDDGQCRTLEEVGQIFGVTRERIRQIEAKALRKLRHPSRSRKLKDYMGD